MQRFTIDSNFREMCDFFHENGYIIIENGISLESVNKLKADLYIEESKIPINKKKDRFRHFTHKRFFEKSTEMINIISDSKIVDFVQYIISDVPSARGNSLQIHLTHNNAFIVSPGGRGQAPSWHTDDALQNVIIPEGKRLPNYVKLPVNLVTCMIWLSDCLAEENGPTFVVPKSHRFGTGIDINYADANDIPMCGLAGTVVIVNNQLWHRGSQNMSQTPRDTVQMTFGRRVFGHMFGSIMNYHLPKHVMDYIYNLSNKTTKQKEQTLHRFGFLEGGAYS